MLQSLQTILNGVRCLFLQLLNLAPPELNSRKMPRKFKSSSTSMLGRRGNTHPRNKYAENPPDFDILASLYPSFHPYVFYAPNGRPRIDWTDYNATRELTRVLLHHDYAINWWIPDGQLCPTVPNRLNYIHWIEDLLASELIPKQHNGDRVRGFDIGTGANCIYPLLGAALHRWHFVGTDITQVALEWAQNNIQNNPHLMDLIEIRKAREGEFEEKNGCTQESGEESPLESLTFDESKKGVAEDDSQLSTSGQPEEPGKEEMGAVNPLLSFNDHQIGESLEVSPSKGSVVVTKNCEGPPVLLGVIRKGEQFDFCMCNPPFFESMEEAGANPRTACGGTLEEMVCPGGEQAFIKRIINDSVHLKEQIRWYTTMVGRKINLKDLTTILRKVGVTIVQTTEFVQGRTSRWGLAWSFVSPSRRTVGVLPMTENTNLSFMLEGLPRHCSASQLLNSVEHFFLACSASCRVDFSSFTVMVLLSDTKCEEVLNEFSGKYVKKSPDEIGSEAIQHKCILESHPNGLSFRISVFEQSPGTLLVKGSLIQNRSLSSATGAFAVLFLQLEETLKKKLGTKLQRKLRN